MKNPLIKRLPRELVGDWHKYLVILIFMTFMIGAVSGLYVGNSSMLKTASDGKTAYNLEDGHFELDKKADSELIKDIESGKLANLKEKFPEEIYKKIEDEYDLDDPDFKVHKVSVFTHFYKEETENNGENEATVRIYKSDSKVDMACFNEGRAPEKEDEIAIDRMHANNVGIKLNDEIKIGGKKFKVVGLISFSNYRTLHKKNTDLMFDAFGFDVGMVIPKAYESISTREHYDYAWFYDRKPETDVENVDFSESFLKALTTHVLAANVNIEDYVPEYLNQAVHFSTDDMKSDAAMGGVLIYILIAVIAFIFAVTISTTIEKEATVIGTLRASGYTKAELVRHYMAMPLLITLIGAVIGNICGYTLFKDIVVKMYYNSYSLPLYKTTWSLDALVQTTLIPLALMFVINLFVIIKSLQLSPLQFLRRDLKKHKRSKAMRLPAWKFIRRFRLRIILQNIPNYLILFFGIAFIEMLLCFGIGFPQSLDSYSKKAPDMMFAPYQYVLLSNKDKEGKVIGTDEPSAEKFSQVGLLRKSDVHNESITVYGVKEDSKYISLPSELKEKEVLVSSAYAGKYAVKKGDTITLDEKYENRHYDFTVAGTFEYDGGVAVFMPDKNFKKVFERDEDSFTGYFSKEEITDIDDKYIATVITKADITKITDQLKHSMGQFMTMFQYVCIILATVLIYLLTKMIIEKNENAISMTKILGFSDKEIASLYIISTSLMVVLFTVAGFAIGYAVINELFKIFMLKYDGWFTFYMSSLGSVKSIIFVFIGYAIVTVFDYIRIRRIPMEQALKGMD